jgi:N-acetyl-anhydromuramyl-L-alanine amidase AmpD
MINKSPQHQKNLILPPGQGYLLRKSDDTYKSFIVHTTNGAAGSKSENELRFLATSRLVSAHYLIGKTGEIFQVLDPESYIAWHTGATASPETANRASIGVEVHFTPAEIDWNVELWIGLTRLARIYQHLEILTHREIAIPKGRKIDPSGVTDAQFSAWKKSLNEPLLTARLKVNSNVRSSPYLQDNIVRTYQKNKVVLVQKNPVLGDTVYNNGQVWYYCNWLGYIHSSLIELGGEV